MNSLRRLEERLGGYRDQRREWRDRCTADKADRLACYEAAQAFDQAQAELSAELPKWERLEKIGAKLLEIFDHPTRSVTQWDADELRAALKEVRDDR